MKICYNLFEFYRLVELQYAVVGLSALEISAN